MTKKPSGGTRRSGFTLVELLVVIGIIALLVGILMPAARTRRKSAQAVQCMSNVRQLGIGFVMYVEKSRGYLPWTGNSDGNATSNPVGPWDDSAYWANSVPKTIGRSSYYDLQLAASKGGAPLAKSGDNNVLACPSAGFAQSASSSRYGEPGRDVHDVRECRGKRTAVCAQHDGRRGRGDAGLLVLCHQLKAR